MSKVKKKVLEIEYMETNKCCTAKLSPNFSFSWFSTTTVNYSITGSIKKIVFSIIMRPHILWQDWTMLLVN